MKKLFPGFLAVLLAFCIALVGCGGGNDNSTPEPEQKQEQTTENKDDSKLGSPKQEEAKPEEAKPEETPAPAPEPTPAQPTQQDINATYIGVWSLVAMEGEDTDVTEDDIKSMNEAGMTVELTFNANGTCSLVMFGEDYSSGTWKAQSTTECTVTMENQRIDVTIDPSTGRLRFFQGDEALIFVRSGDAPASTGNSGGSTTTTTTPPAAANYDALDSKGNPTFYSILELSGTDLVKAIEDEGFKWNSEKKWWISSDGNDCFYVSGNNDYEYIRSEITALQPNGKGDSCVYVIVVDDRDYSSGQDVLKKLGNITILDQEWLDETLGVAVVQGPSGASNIVIINYNDEVEVYVVDVFNEKAISSGLLEEYLGDDYGDTAAEVWQNLFNRSI